MGFEAFTEHFGPVIEQSPLVAATVWSHRPFPTANSLQDAFTKFLTDLPASTKGGVLRCHPDLAGRLAEEHSLSEASTQEQSSAGLLSLTASERDELRTLNTAYRERFGFPFVICVRENKKAAIFSGIRARLENTPGEELEIGLREVCKIARLRLSDLLTADTDSVHEPKL